ncbi:MAG: glycosyltransferase family 1 protein [Candidatus Beckwithbacteria bacterium]
MLIGIDASRAFVKDRTGTENYSHELIKAMLKLPESKKHRFRLYVRKPEGSELALRDRLSINSRLEVRNLKTLEVVEINWPRLWTQGGLAVECLKNPPDVLFVPAHTLPVIRRTNLKTVVTIHGLEYEYLPEFYDWRKKWYLNKSTEYAVRKADKLIAVSNWTKSQLVDRLGADESKIKVIYEGVGERFRGKGLSGKVDPSFANAQVNTPQMRGFRKGINLKYARQIRYKYGLGKNYILFLGTIQPRKNLVRLVEAFSRITTEGSELALRDRLSINSRLEVRNQTRTDLIIAGKKGWMTEEIYEAPKKYGVQDRVKFIGRVAEADIVAVYKMASLFVWPSLMEGFGLPILEAFASGVPVIASKRGALPEVVGEAGLLIDPENVEELAKAIDLVFKSKELRQGLVEKGYKQVKKFSWDKAAKETLDLLIKVKMLK